MKSEFYLADLDLIYICPFGVMGNKTVCNKGRPYQLDMPKDDQIPVICPAWKWGGPALIELPPLVKGALGRRIEIEYPAHCSRLHIP